VRRDVVEDIVDDGEDATVSKIMDGNVAAQQGDAVEAPLLREEACSTSGTNSMESCETKVHANS
jgi:hypothetical protein